MTTQNPWTSRSDDLTETTYSMANRIAELRREVDALKEHLRLALPPAELYITENGHRSMCVWVDGLDPKYPDRPVQLLNLDVNLPYRPDPLCAWLERVLPHRESEADQ